jgi:probable rRNA maturation factor
VNPAIPKNKITSNSSKDWVNITISNLQNKLLIPRVKIKNLVLEIFKGEKVKKTGYINICFMPNLLMRKLNARFLKTIGSTDVIAFNLSDKKTKKTIFADIAISTDTAIKNAREFRTTSEYELLLYVAHGILHVLGFDDQTKAQAQLMRKKEKEYVDR